MSQKGFTLIELLVVVAIVDILAAVGVLAYSGYTSAAKAKTVKTNFNIVKKYFANELFKCEAGMETQAYEKYISNPSYYSKIDSRGCSTNYTGNSKFQYIADNIGGYVMHYRDEFGIQNPYNLNDKNAVNVENKCPTTNLVGRINWYTDEDKNLVFVCARFGEEANDIIQATIPNPYQ